MCLLLKLLGTDADTYLLGAHDRHFFERVGKMSQQSRTGRGAQLALHAATIDRNPGQQIGGCRCGYRHDAVCAAHRTASHMYRRDDHAVDTQKIHCVAHAGYVCNSIQCTDFVIMHVAHRAAMRLGLGLCNGIIDRTGVLLDCVRQIQAVDDFRDMTGRCMVVMVAVFMRMIVMVVMFVVMVMVVVVLMFMVIVMMMVMLVIVLIVVVMMVFMFMIVMVMMVVLMRVRLVFLFPVYGHTHVRTCDTAGLSRFGGHLHAVQAQFLHFLQKCGLIVQ